MISNSKAIWARANNAGTQASLDLDTSLILGRDGYGGITYPANDTTDYQRLVPDHEGIDRGVKQNASRHYGARIVENLVDSPHVAANWTQVLGVASLTEGQADPFGGALALRVVTDGGSTNHGPYIAANHSVNDTVSRSIYLKSATGSNQPAVLTDTGTNDSVPVTVTSEWKRFSFPASGTTLPSVWVKAGTTAVLDIYMFGAQVEQRNGATDTTTPSEHVSNGVLSAPFHGNNVDGQKSFTTENGNSVASNVVTEGTGAAISPSTLKGLMMEGAATNLFLNSTAPVTQDITLSTGLHTVSVHGTGSVTSSDNTATSTGHGAASDGTPITFNVSVGGSVTFTVSGSPDYVQVETGGVPTSPIVTAGTSVTRPASTDATIDDANLNDPNFTLTVTVTPNHPSTALTGTQQVITLGANAFLSYNHTSTRWEVTNGTTTATVTDTFTAGQSVVLKIRGSQAANELQISADTTAGTAVAYSGSLPAGNITFAEMGGQANFKNVEIYRRDKGAGWLVE